MYHTIEFAERVVLDLEISPKQRMEQLLVQRGDRMQAQLRPYVIEGEDGPVEVADLFFADGTTARAIPFARFSFFQNNTCGRE